MNYRFAYSSGSQPREDAAEDPPFVEKATEPFAREVDSRRVQQASGASAT